MKTLDFWTIVVISFGLFILSIVMYSWPPLGQVISPNSPIDVDKFSSFGSFVGGLFGTLSFILLIFTLKESKNQSFESSLLNFVQLHDSLVQQLNSNDNIISTLEKKYNELFIDNLCEKCDSVLKEECTNYKLFSHDGYFECLYRILHVRYKYKDQDPSLFFKDYNSKVGHFIESFISMIDLIYEAKLDRQKKYLYSNIIKARSTSDEIRLIFYFVTFNTDDKVKLRLVKRFKYLKFFDVLRDGLIKNGDKEIFERIKV